MRLMIETGARAGEVVALSTEDVDLSTGTATVRRGKGGRGRVVPFGSQTSRALDRYLRVRRSHRLADTPALWLGDRGKAFSYDALHKTLGERARAAGIEGFRPHRLRHTAAHRWLVAGGSEGGLMGWPAGHGRTCCCATRARKRRPVPPPRLASWDSTTSDGCGQRSPSAAHQRYCRRRSRSDLTRPRKSVKKPHVFLLQSRTEKRSAVLEQQQSPRVLVTGPVAADIVGTHAVSRFGYLHFTYQRQSAPGCLQSGYLGSWVAADVEVV